MRDTNDKKTLKVVSALTVITIIAALAWLTMSDEDPCANPQADISASVLGEANGDQDALANRAIIMRGNCEQE